MPSTRTATLCRDDLPDVATASELAAYERIDVRTLRHDLEAGAVPGAFRRGRSWRIDTQVYFAALERLQRTETT